MGEKTQVDIFSLIETSGVCEHFGISKKDAIRELKLLIAEHFGTADIRFGSNHFYIDGKYRSLRSRDAKKIEREFYAALIRLYSKNIKEFILNTLIANDDVLYCELAFETQKSYYLRPFINKDTPLQFLLVKVSKDVPVTVPQGITRFPVDVIRSSRRVVKQKPNLFHAYGRILTPKTAAIHLRYIEDALLEKFNARHSFRFAGLNINKKKGKAMVFIATDDYVRMPVIRYVKRYFGSFGVGVVFDFHQ